MTIIAERSKGFLKAISGIGWAIRMCEVVAWPFEAGNGAEIKVGIIKRHSVTTRLLTGTEREGLYYDGRAVPYVCGPRLKGGR